MTMGFVDTETLTVAEPRIIEMIKTFFSLSILSLCQVRSNPSVFSVSILCFAFHEQELVYG